MLSAFVNLREGPSSSRQVIGVMDRGSKLRIIGRKRAWLKVSDAASSQTGWIYSLYAASVTKPRRAVSKAPSMLSASGAEPGSDDAMWTRLGRWAIGPGCVLSMRRTNRQHDPALGFGQPSLISASQSAPCQGYLDERGKPRATLSEASVF